MIYTRIKENSYQDSINLMLLTNAVNTVDGVNSAQVMMGTDANKDLFKDAGLSNDQVANAQPNDMVVAIDSESEAVLEEVMIEVENYLSDLSVKKDADSTESVTNWKEATEALTDANVALISIPGIYAAAEIERALDDGKHAFVFSDNIPIEEEVRLKKKAHDKGLLVMGPDSGTGMISSVPLAFTNVIKPGNIGMVGASGTGIQEVTTIIDRLGGGVVNAVGVGGRDLSEEVGAITMLDALAAMDKQADVDVIVAISKPPAKAVRDKVVAMLHSLSKPVVAIFLGEKP
ncbi:MAG: acyl-CoA synthetase FdrA, partial [Alkalibacterium sp.]